LADKNTPQKTPVEVSNVLSIDTLAVGDRPSIYTLGLVGAESLKRTKMAVFMVDVLGHVRLMPPEAVEVKAKPQLTDDELDELDEMEAIQALIAQGDSDDFVAKYLHRRSQRKAL
jgi:hypothetical protein